MWLPSVHIVPREPLDTWSDAYGIRVAIVNLPDADRLCRLADDDDDACFIAERHAASADKVGRRVEACTKRGLEVLQAILRVSYTGDVARAVCDTEDQNSASAIGERRDVLCKFYRCSRSFIGRTNPHVESLFDIPKLGFDQCSFRRDLVDQPPNEGVICVNMLSILNFLAKKIDMS